MKIKSIKRLGSNWPQSWYNSNRTNQINKKTMKDSPQYSKILLDLIHLRATDYDAFMDKLYEALTGEFKNALYDTSPVEEKQEAIWSMIKHFEKQEEFEKCADLKRMVDGIHAN